MTAEEKRAEKAVLELTIAALKSQKAALEAALAKAEARLAELIKQVGS